MGMRRSTDIGVICAIGNGKENGRGRGGLSVIGKERGSGMRIMQRRRRRRTSLGDYTRRICIGTPICISREFHTITITMSCIGDIILMLTTIIRHQEEYLPGSLSLGERMSWTMNLGRGMVHRLRSSRLICCRSRFLPVRIGRKTMNASASMKGSEKGIKSGIGRESGSGVGRCIILLCHHRCISLARRRMIGKDHR